MVVVLEDKVVGQEIIVGVELGGPGSKDRPKSKCTCASQASDAFAQEECEELS